MIVIDPAHFSWQLTPGRIQLICDRHFGVGGDGICYGPEPDSRPFSLRFFNPDGSEAEKSGNGLRIFSRYLWDAGYVHQRSFDMTIQGQIVPAEILNDAANHIRLGMGQLRFEWEDTPHQFGSRRMAATAVSIGNPHCVIFTGDLDQIHELGPVIETSPIFPSRTNVQLVTVIDAHSIQIAIWERGAGYTLASGTSASAAAGTAVRLGHCQSPVTVKMAGGDTRVAVDPSWRVTLEGAVTAVYHGDFSSEMARKLTELGGDNESR